MKKIDMEKDVMKQSLFGNLQTKNKVAIMSIRPHFSEKIFNKTKKYEFRRRNAKALNGHCVYVYESAPTCALVGLFTTSRVIYDCLDRIDSLISQDSDEYLVRQYLKGCAKASAIKIEESMHFDSPLSLSSFCGKRRPPQSYCFIR